MTSSDVVAGAAHQNSSLEINKHDKFFTRIMSKETSMANSSCRVYYGGASGAVPFMWETRPGTPKHTLFSESSIPPLTPPPSYQHVSPSSKSSKSNHKRMIFNIKPPNLLAKYIKFPTPTKNNKNLTPSSSSSISSTSTLSSSSSSSSSYSPHSAYMFTNPTTPTKVQARPGLLSCSRSPVHYTIDDDSDEYEEMEVDNREHGHRLSPTSTLCYGTVKNYSSNKVGFVRGCELMRSFKIRFLSMVGHGSAD